MWATTLALGATAVALVPITGFNTVGEPAFVAAMLAMSTIGALVAIRQPRNRIAWLLMGVAMAGASTSFGPQIGLYAVEQSPLGEAVGRTALQLRDVGIVGYLGGLSLLGITAPDGRLPTGRWRRVVWVPVTMAVAAVVITVIDLWLSPSVNVAAALRTEVVFDAANNAQRPAMIAIVGEVAMGMLLLASALVGAAAPLARLRSAHGDERQQLKWIVIAVGVALALPFLTLFEATALAPDVLRQLVPALTALAVSTGFGLALFRYRLYQVDLVVNRSIVYGILSTAIIGIYVGIVWGIGSMLGVRGGFGVSLTGAAVVALVANPARIRVQKVVNRAMFGDRDDPYQVLHRMRSSFERALSPAETLQAAVADIADALRLRFVAIDVGEPGERLAAWGSETENTTFVPLRHQRLDIGWMVVGPRSSGEALGATDRSVLEDVAAHMASVVVAARLTEDLQRSRQRLVAAREEERRRLRRDLHDGLGPTLAAFTLQLETARNLLGSDPDRAEALLEELKAQASTAADDIRGLVDNLRPPALDEVGLLGALEQQAARLGAIERGSGTTIEITATDWCVSLPAAVEVAAYRIAAEAMTNVARHSNAQTCRVHLDCDKQLHLEITDDGCGLPATATAGIGLRSIVERAEELGGGVTISPAAGGGTKVLARLPLVEQEIKVP